ncbi:hypothetical protein [Arthrobacter sp. NPDC090010]|uniref:hypothetical protein n=1 Tax=Arthrobacter sp. NPDC090010 TaxID=3363942 RepID=UPI0038036CA2
MSSDADKEAPSQGWGPATGALDVGAVLGVVGSEVMLGVGLSEGVDELEFDGLGLGLEEGLLSPLGVLQAASPSRSAAAAAPRGMVRDVRNVLCVLMSPTIDLYRLSWGN